MGISKDFAPGETSTVSFMGPDVFYNESQMKFIEGIHSDSLNK